MYRIKRRETAMPARGKTIMFIDNSNIFHGSRDAKWRIDAKKLHAKLEAEGPIWQTFFFAAVSDPPRLKQTGFYKMLKNDLHYETTVFPLGNKTVRCKKCGDSRHSYTEKGIDVALATKMLVLANNRAFETAILVSGDKDYLETVKAVKSLGLRVEVVSWKRALSLDLAQESSRNVILLDDLRKEIEKPADAEIEKLIPEEEE
jgi:uncharacterized LabA/DUF88 family protein